MNICMIIWKYYPCPEGGAERQCRKIVAELMGRGHTCTILTAKVTRDLKHNDNGLSGESVIRLGKLAWLELSAKRKLDKVLSSIWPSRNTPLFLNFWLLFPFTWISRLSFILSLKRVLLRSALSPDIIHVHEGHWIAGAAGWAGRGLVGVPIVCKEATYPFREIIGYDTPMRSILIKVRKELHFIAITTAIRQSMVESGISENRISFIPNGVVVCSEPAKIVDSHSVVYIGNFTQGTHQKAFDILFEAWAKVNKKLPNLTLTVIGGGDTRIWEEYLEANGCRESVLFKGIVNNVDEYLQKARMFLLPSRIEGLSNALLEAMSCGVPAIVSDIPAHESLVIPDQTGLVVPVNDCAALANAIVSLYFDTPTALRVAENAREKIVSEYSIESVNDSLLQLYLDLIEKYKKTMGKTG